MNDSKKTVTSKEMMIGSVYWSKQLLLNTVQPKKAVWKKNEKT